MSRQLKSATAIRVRHLSDKLNSDVDNAVTMYSDARLSGCSMKNASGGAGWVVVVQIQK